VERFENTIKTEIEARRSDEIERELQLSCDLNDAVRREIDRRWMERIQTWEGLTQTGAAPMEGITTSNNPASQTRPMEGITIDGPARPTIEEFSEGLLSSWGIG
jgi:ribosomal protein S13